MSCQLKSRSWFAALHYKYKDDFGLFKEIYSQMTDWEFGINFSGRMTILDAAHLYLLIREYKPKIILETCSANGFATSIMAAASKANSIDFRILTYEKHPGPRIAATERARHLKYDQNIITLSDLSDKEKVAKLRMLGKIDFLALKEHHHLHTMLKYMNNKSIAFFDGNHSDIEISCSHVKDYMMPDNLDHRDLIIGSWWDILDSWDYISFGEKVFHNPYSTALFWE